MAMNLDDIRYFQVTASTLNMTRASEKLGVSQPALSYSIKRIENEVDGKLFIREKSGLLLTKFGEEFLKKSRQLIFCWEELEKIVDPISKEAVGTYTFAIHPSVALYTLNKFFKKVVSEFPLLEFKFIHGASKAMTEKIISWEADFGIVVNPVKHPDLIMKKLCIDEVSIFHRLNCENKLIFDPNLTQSKQLLKKLNKSSIKFNGEIHSSNLEVMADLVSSGVGLGILPERVAKKLKGVKKLEEAPTYSDQIFLIYRSEKHKNKTGQSIISKIINSDF